MRICLKYQSSANNIRHNKPIRNLKIVPLCIFSVFPKLPSMVAKEGNLKGLINDQLLIIIMCCLLLKMLMKILNVDDGGGNLSHEENFFCICLLIWNDSSEKNTIKAVLLNNFSC